MALFGHIFFLGHKNIVNLKNDICYDSSIRGKPEFSDTVEIIRSCPVIQEYLKLTGQNLSKKWGNGFLPLAPRLPHIMSQDLDSSEQLWKITKASAYLLEGLVFMQRCLADLMACDGNTWCCPPAANSPRFSTTTTTENHVVSFS